MDAATVLPLLEMGRGALNNRLMDIRSDLTDLFEDHPDLADSFVKLRQKLNQTPATDMTYATTSSRWRFRASQEMKELLDTIRQQDKYHRFNLPQTAEEITSTASKGPVIVVNPSTWRCDAFLVDENKGIQLKELPDLTVADKRFEKGIQSLKDPETLAWLWRSLCLPCLEALGFDKPLDSNWRRVWWIPTNGLDRIPLHAAGIYEPGGRDTVLDRVISSYASSIRALQYTRRASPMQSSNDPVSKNAVLVSVPVADPEGKTYRPLSNVVSEMEIVERGCRKLSLDVIQLQPAPKKADVLAQLPQCKLLHFSGHGDSKPDPSQSLLVLEDWATNSLTVSDLRQTFRDSSSPFLAFLSACSSGQNKGKDLPDESLHMMSAMQLAGFRHVIGTLWEIFDQPCVEVADTFYATLRNYGGLTHDAVALGLHLAVRKLRDGKGDGPEKGPPKVTVDGELVKHSPRVTASQLLSTAWLPYVHFGP